jgi:hypothetical protein
MTKVLTAKEVAQALDTDPRTLRKFLRADAKANGTETPGKGSRYAIEAKQVRSLKTRFNRWIDAKTPKTEEAPEVLESDNSTE